MELGLSLVCGRKTTQVWRDGGCMARAGGHGDEDGESGVDLWLFSLRSVVSWLVQEGKSLYIERICTSRQHLHGTLAWRRQHFEMWIQQSDVIEKTEQSVQISSSRSLI